MRFGHVHFPVSDLARAVAFYRDALELPIGLYIEGSMAAFDVGLVLDQAEGEALRRLADRSAPGTRLRVGTPPPGPKITAITFAIDVDDVDALYDRLKAKGVSLGGPPRDQPWGARNFYLRDLDGYVVEFVLARKREPA